MYTLRRFFMLRRLFFLLCAVLLLRSEEVGSLRARAHGLTYTKTDGELIISFARSSTNRDGDQVEIYDALGNWLTGVKVLGSVADADGVSIYDVSARRDERIAVAADFVNKSGIVPALLYFDFKGTILSAVALDASREIRLLAIDNDLGVWALGMGTGQLNPVDVPLVVSYDSRGAVRKELLKRADFPADAAIIQEGPGYGTPAMGLTPDGIWIWLTGSKELVTIAGSDLSVTRMVTSLPEPQPHARLDLASDIKTSSGQLIGEFSEREEGPPHVSYYRWSRESASWSTSASQDCRNHFLIGTLKSRPAFIGFGTGSVCVGEK